MKTEDCAAQLRTERDIARGEIAALQRKLDDVRASRDSLDKSREYFQRELTEARAENLTLRNAAVVATERAEQIVKRATNERNNAERAMNAERERAEQAEERIVDFIKAFEGKNNHILAFFNRNQEMREQITTLTERAEKAEALLELVDTISLAEMERRIAAAVEAEREACAVIALKVERMFPAEANAQWCAVEIAAKIRARGKP